MLTVLLDTGKVKPFFWITSITFGSPPSVTILSILLEIASVTVFVTKGIGLPSESRCPSPVLIKSDVLSGTEISIFLLVICCGVPFTLTLSRTFTSAPSEMPSNLVFRSSEKLFCDKSYPATLSTFESKEVCKSVWALMLPLMLPHSALVCVLLITRLPTESSIIWIPSPDKTWSLSSLSSTASFTYSFVANLLTSGISIC